MARIRVARRVGGKASHRHGQWLDVVDADALRLQIDGLLDPEGSGDGRDWEVLAYDGLPDFGPQPALTELLAWLDAAEEFGEAFEVWWKMQSFSRVIEAADAFADHYQGTYADRTSWARHTLGLMGEQIGGQRELDAAVVNGEVKFIDAVGGGIHVFWND